MKTHPLPTNLHQALVEWIDGRRGFALVTVLKDAGSTPRKAGTNALVDIEGNIWGTIGGGLLESEARHAAVESIRTGRPIVYDFHFSGASARGDDPVCGGVMRVLIDPTVAEHRHPYEQARTATGQRRRGVLLTTVEGREAPQVSMTWLDEGAAPPAGGKVAEAIDAARSSETAQYFAATIEGLADPVIPIPLLLIAGGGHVAQALARHASLLGWQIVAIDDRPEFADPSLYPASVHVRRGSVGEVAAQWPLNRDTYVAIVGRGHKVDAAALATVIHAPVAFVGMMGSRRKVALVWREFIESGMATQQQLDRVHAPIGLDIGAQTVEEIAASIVAELVAVRRGRRPRRGA